MKRLFTILGASMVVVVVLAVAIAGTVSAAGNNPGIGTQTQNQGQKCLCGQCPCGDGVCDDCTPINNSYNYYYSDPGPHGQQNGK